MLVFPKKSVKLQCSQIIRAFNIISLFFGPPKYKRIKKFTICLVGMAN